ncbi:MAG: hypothetical protein K6B52_02820 [Clostridiales bacterium]|nr:hypothetical protein [Clostridiales bacterium]
MDKKKKRLIIDLILLAVVAVGWIYLSRDYPELRIPKWGDYSSSAPAEPSGGSPYKYYYDTLSNVQKHAYNMILDEIYDMPSKIEIPKITSDDLTTVFESLLFDNPDMFFVNRECEVVSKLGRMFFIINYSMTQDEYIEKKAELDAKCDEIISKIDTSKGDYVTEKAIHDYIVNNTDYTYVSGDTVTSSAYGSLINGLASCEGYSRAAKYLFDKVGIESSTISGTARNTSGVIMSHMWNVVKIGGKYYHLDCTWDDPVSSNNKKTLSHAYFNVSEKVLSKDHFNFSIDLNCE